MADRRDQDLVEMVDDHQPGQPGGSGLGPLDFPIQTVRGTGRVEVIAAGYETMQRQVVVAGQTAGVPAVRPEDQPVTRTEAAEGMHDLERRAAAAIAGTAAQSAHAVNVLAEQASSAVQQTAQSSQEAVQSLEDRTRDAFGRAESVMGTVQQEVSTTVDRIAELEAALTQER